MKTTALFATALALMFRGSIAAAAPAGGFLVNEADLSLPSPETLTRRQAEEDVRYFVEVMNGGYAALAAMREKDPGAERVLSGLEKKISALPEPVSVETLLDILAAPLAVFHDTHLSLFAGRADGSYSQRRPAEKQRAYLVSLPVPGGELIGCGNEPAARLLFPFLQKEGGSVRVSSAPVYFSSKPGTEVVCNLRRAGAAADLVAKLAKHEFIRATSGQAFSFYDGDVPVLRLEDLDLGRTTDIEAFLRSAVKVRDSRSFVLDVRGNPGGSDLSVDPWLETLSSADGLNPEPNQEDRFLLGPVTLQGLLNSLAGLGDSPQALKLKGYVHEKQKALGAAQPPGFVSSDKFWGNIGKKMYRPEKMAASVYRGGVVLLADSGCASSCEDLVGKLRARLKAPVILVGQNTSGTGEYGELGTYVLPNSRVRVRLATTQFKNYPGFKEGRGYLPDFWIAEEDPLPAAKAAALCLRSIECAAKLTGGRGGLAPAAGK